MKNVEHFNCTCCGACCQQLEVFGQEYKWLDNGNGTCVYFDEKTNLCSVYEIRPLICRVDFGYSLYASKLSYDEYVRLTNIACNLLQKRFREKVKGNASEMMLFDNSSL